jgi:hypothetical protein
MCPEGLTLFGRLIYIQSMLNQIKDFRNKIRHLERWQKVSLLAVAIAIPAGIMIASFIILALKSSNNKRR